MAESKFQDKEKVLETVLRTAARDDPQEKLMALLMVAKHLPGVYARDGWAAAARKRILDAVSPFFVMSLLKPSKSGEIDLDTSRIMGMRVISAFGIDEHIAAEFVPCLPVLLKLLRTNSNAAVVELALDCSRHICFCEAQQHKLPFDKIITSLQTCFDRVKAGNVSDWQEVDPAEFLSRLTQMRADLLSLGASQSMKTGTQGRIFEASSSLPSENTREIGLSAASTLLQQMAGRLSAEDREMAVSAAHDSAEQLEHIVSLYEAFFPAPAHFIGIGKPIAVEVLKLLHSDLEASHKSDVTRIATCLTALASPKLWLQEGLFPVGSGKHGRWAALLLLVQLWGVDLKLTLDAVDECCLAAWPEESSQPAAGASASASSATASQASNHLQDAQPDWEADDDGSSSDDEAPPAPLSTSAAGASESKSNSHSPKRPSAASVPSEAFNWKPGEKLPARLRPPSAARRSELQVAPRGVEDRCRVLRNTLKAAKFGMLPLLRSIDSSVQLLLQASDSQDAEGLPTPPAETLGMFRGALQEVMKIIILHIGEYHAATTALGLVQPQQQQQHAQETARCAVGLAFAAPLLLAAHDCLLEYAAVDCAGLEGDLVSSAPALLHASSNALSITLGPLSKAEAAHALLQAAGLPLPDDIPPLHEWVGMLHGDGQPLMLPAVQQWSAVAADCAPVLEALATAGGAAQAAKWLLQWTRRCAMAGMAAEHTLARGDPKAAGPPTASLPPCLAAEGMEAAAAVADALQALQQAAAQQDSEIVSAIQECNRLASWLLLCADEQDEPQGEQQTVPDVPRGIVHLVTASGCLQEEHWQCAVGELYQLTSGDH